MQLGHALAECHRIDEGVAAYKSAAALRPGIAEPYLHLGHISKRGGRHPDATRYYASGLVRQGHEEELEEEVFNAVRRVANLPPSLVRAVIRHNEAATAHPQTPAEDAAADLDAAMQRLGQTASADDLRTLSAAREALRHIGRANTPASASERPLVFDLTDLVAHFRHNRLPTGIQRVQIEVLATALKTHGHDKVGICCFIDGREHWIEIPIPMFLELAYLATSGSDANDPAWQLLRARLFFHLAVDGHYTLPDRAILVNLGTSWWIYDYYRMVRNAKERQGISYIPFIHDFIPIMAPEHCVRGVIEDYVSWAVGVFQHADLFLVNSQSTRRDLLRVAERLGHEVPEDRIEVVPLDADFRRTSSSPLPDSALAQWGLEGVPFALFVSTIESRKNHILAFEAWAELLRRHGKAKVPRLVCVGRNGWLNDHIFARLTANAELRSHVTIIHQASDEELVLFYRSCQFTVYPSHYEGWGLPITESLCYGKVPLIADNSSLPEAGAGFAIVFEDDSVTGLVEAVEKVTFDAEWRTAREAEIRAGFAPRTWTQVAGQISDAIGHFAGEGEGSSPVARPVSLGAYYPVSLYRDTPIWHGLASGEIFRTGEGWLWPETFGCRTRPEGGELRMDLPVGSPNLRLYLRLHGLAHAPCPFEVIVDGQVIAKGRIEASTARWIGGDLPDGLTDTLTVLIRGGEKETVSMSHGGTTKHPAASIAVAGFALCKRDDEDARARFIEAAAFGSIEELSAYRKRA
jgi:glycosyltransferase involved in cell wall biosynthesis